MVHFVGAGSGAVDLITVRGKNLLEQADVIMQRKNVKYLTVHI